MYSVSISVIDWTSCIYFIFIVQEAIKARSADSTALNSEQLGVRIVPEPGDSGGIVEHSPVLCNAQFSLHVCTRTV